MTFATTQQILPSRVSTLHPHVSRRAAALQRLNPTVEYDIRDERDIQSLSTHQQPLCLALLLCAAAKNNLGAVPWSSFFSCSHVVPGQDQVAPTDEFAETWIPSAGTSPTHAVPGSCAMESRMSQRLDVLAESLRHKQVWHQIYISFPRTPKR